MSTAREHAANARRQLYEAAKTQGAAVDLTETGCFGQAVEIGEHARDARDWAQAEALVAIALALTEPRPEPEPRVVKL